MLKSLWANSKTDFKSTLQMIFFSNSQDTTLMGLGILLVTRKKTAQYWEKGRQGGRGQGGKKLGRKEVGEERSRGGGREEGRRGRQETERGRKELYSQKLIFSGYRLCC